MNRRPNDHPETLRLLALLRDRVGDSRRSDRALEQQAGFTSGTLQKILRRRTDLRVDHICQLAEPLGLTVAEFFLGAYAEVAFETFRKLLPDTARAALQAAPSQSRPVGLDTSPFASFLDTLAEKYGPLELVLLTSKDPQGGPPWHMVIAAKAFDELSRNEAIRKVVEVLGGCAPALRSTSHLDAARPRSKRSAGISTNPAVASLVRHPIRCRPSCSASAARLRRAAPVSVSPAAGSSGGPCARSAWAKS